MSAMISPLAGKLPPASIVLDVPALLAAYFERRPDPRMQRRSCSDRYRGSSFEGASRMYLLAISPQSATNVGMRASSARCTSSSTRTRCRNLRSDHGELLA